MTALTLDPDSFTRVLALPDGATATLRLIRPADREPLGRYFMGLSPATRRLYAPHPFDLETAEKICAAIDYTDTLRFLLVVQQHQIPGIIAYFIVKLGTNPGDRRRYEERGMDLDETTTCSLAPSVADAYQSQGLGSLMMPPILAIARSLGYRRMVLIGGTRADNHRAIRFYQKNGFRKVGDFQVGDLGNHDMILEL